MNDEEKQILKQEFGGFVTPEGFSGGCKKSKGVKDYCCHLRHDGTIGKFEKFCPDYKECKGYNFSYRV